MTHTNNRLFDEFAKLMTDAAGVAQGVRDEAETAIRAQLERLMGDMDLVSRDEFEAVKEMAVAARDENDRLAARLIVLEEKLGIQSEPDPEDVSPV
ncbi:accessory factor UbiK family protein [Cohaesibacter celericrescens]|uniref:Pyrroline-5-carboxylate reductase n=1 Tax=Cohaesibacter celericrescens TaxID=2067669 RepID=A0A2N5XXC9_9HYPH|nr:accessory factor UbiK family protein [Cohaesibacter celericrescens]PLW79150.1 pyrroline-5-carboxylate reductase [Cohaesibacter celericrescens]